MTSAWATIIAAVIGVVGTMIITKFDDIISLFRRNEIEIEGDWDIVSYKIQYENDSLQNKNWTGEYTVRIKQNGKKISGEMRATKVTESMQLFDYKWKGRIKGSYLVYQSDGKEMTHFLLSTALLYIHTTGNKMSGYFVVASGHDEPERTWVGFTELKKRN
ncbi:MAG: hypothetical protein ACE5JB_14560 [bacterium]